MSDQYISSLQRMFLVFDDIMTHIQEEHLELMTKTPFNLLLREMYEQKVSENKKKDSDLDAIIRSFVPATKAFRIGNKYCKLYREDVKLILGISNGDHEMDITKGKRCRSKFADRCFRGQEQIKLKEVKDVFVKLVRRKSKQGREDFVRALCLLIVGSCLFSTTGVKIAWAYIPYIEDLDTMKQFNWSGCILSNHIESLKVKYTTKRSMWMHVNPIVHAVLVM